MWGLAVSPDGKTAVTTHGAGCGTAFGCAWPRSHPPNRHGPTNSSTASAAPSGSFPQPFIRRSIPRR